MENGAMVVLSQVTGVTQGEDDLSFVGCSCHFLFWDNGLKLWLWIGYRK